MIKFDYSPRDGFTLHIQLITEGEFEGNYKFCWTTPTNPKGQELHVSPSDLKVLSALADAAYHAHGEAQA